MNYVQNILVPLLNAEYTIPVAFHPFDKINQRWMSDPKKILQYSKKLKQEQHKEQEKEEIEEAEKP